MGEKKNTYKFQDGNPERKILLGEPRCIWEDNIKWIIKKQ
jgi:hypothetical protein